MQRATLTTPQHGDYEVGKGRPPQSTRWKPGQSGNPKGRPIRAKGLKTFLYEALHQRIEIQSGGKKRKITAVEAIARTIIHQALKGDVKALAFLLANEPEITRAAQVARHKKLITPDMDIKEASEVYARLVRGDEPLNGL